MTAGIRQLFSDVTVYSIALVLRRALSFATLPVLTRFLSVRELGVLALLGTVHELLTVAFQLGVPNAAESFYYDARTPAERRRLFGTLLVFLLGASFLAAALLIAVGPSLWRRLVGDVPFHPYVSLTVATVFLSGMGVLPRSLFRVTNRIPRYAALALAHGVLAAGLTVVLVVGAGLGVLGTVLGEFLTALVFFSSSLVA